MFEKAKELVKKHSRIVATSAVVLSMSALPAFASGTADSTVTTAFTTLEGNAAATLASVAAIGVGIMGVFLAWKYGRKIFNQVAK